MTTERMSVLNMNRRNGCLSCEQWLRFDVPHRKRMHYHISCSPPYRPSLLRTDEIESTALVKRSEETQINCFSSEATSIEVYNYLITPSEAAGGLCE